VIYLNDLVDAGEIAVEGVDRTDDSLLDQPSRPGSYLPYLK
jgi:hypothetical protein